MSNEIMHDEMKVRRSMEREELKKTDDDDVMMMCADGDIFLTHDGWTAFLTVAKLF